MAGGSPHPRIPGGARVRALSLTQPWATLIAIGAKRIETRSWSTSYRARIAIHASKTMPGYCRRFAYSEPAWTVLNIAGITLGDNCETLPRGAIIATATLADVVRTEDITAMSQGLLRHEIEFGEYARGRYGWILQDVVALAEPIPCKGALGLWAVPADIAARIATDG